MSNVPNEAFVDTLFRIVDDLPLIRLAIALGRHGNFARQARGDRCFAANLTRGIAALERSLGVSLFDRTRKGAIPTVFGRVLLERGESMLRDDADLRRKMQLLAGLEAGSVAIGAGAFAGEISVPRAIARASRLSTPADQVHHCRPGSSGTDVSAGRIDVGVASTVGLESDVRLVVETLPPLRVYLACRPDHPLARETRPSLARALELPSATTQFRGAQAATCLKTGAPQDRKGLATAFDPQIVVNSSRMRA